MSAVRFTVLGEPVSKARARFTGYGSKVRAYTPEKVTAAEQRVAWTFRQAGGRFEPDREVTFSVEATFYSGTRHRRDVDNMLKLLLDGLNGVAWVDDLQVTDLTGRKRLVAKEEARTEVVVTAIGRLDYPKAVCGECGATFRTYNSWAAKRYCSDDCRLAERRRNRRRVCQHCGKEWDPGKPSEAKFCSMTCRYEHGRADATCTTCGQTFRTQRCAVGPRNFCSAECRRKREALDAKERRTKSFPGTCQVCGAGATRKEYRRCNPCKLAGYSIPDGVA